MERKQFTVILITAFAILLSAAIFKAKEDFWLDNLLPETMGICIELFIILLVFDKWQKNAENKNHIKIERRLREFLIFFLKHNFSDYPPSCNPGSFYGENHKQNQEALNNLIKFIEENGISEETVLRVQKYCENEKEIFNNLIPVASELTNDHFKSWVRISYFMNSISSKNEKTSHALIKILQNIKRFDEQSYSANLYVGAD